MEAHQALHRPWDSPGKNIGVGCHFLLQCVKVRSESEVAQSCPTLSDPHGLQPTRLLRPWDFPGKRAGVGCHRLLCLCLLTPFNSQCLWGLIDSCPQEMSWGFCGRNKLQTQPTSRSQLLQVNFLKSFMDRKKGGKNTNQPQDQMFSIPNF